MLIGLTGYKQVGKSTIAEILRDEHHFLRISFADPLKKMLQAIGLTYADLYGDKKETPNDLLLGKTPREAMQTLGTEWGRDMMGEMLWVKLWERGAVPYLEAGISVVVDDLRFPCESKRIKELGGIVVRVERNSPQDNGHRSESSVADVYPDYVIQNNASIDDLRSYLAEVVKLRNG